MTKKLLFRSERFPYHVVNQVNNRDWFYLPPEITWQLITHECYVISILYDVQIHAFVLMSNHFHMMISTPHANLDAAMSHFGAFTTRSFNLKAGRSGHLFTGRYKWSVINSPQYYANALKYIYRNPVKAEITQLTEDYPYSTLHGLMGSGHLPFPLTYPQLPLMDLFVPIETEDFLAWLNNPFKPGQDEKIRKDFAGSSLRCRKAFKKDPGSFK